MCMAKWLPFGYHAGLQRLRIGTLALLAKRRRGRHPKMTPPRPTDSGVLDLDFDVDTGREFDALERIDGLGGGIHDVDEALMNAHLEVLA
jgi:hypothetical protein